MNDAKYTVNRVKIDLAGMDCETASEDHDFAIALLDETARVEREYRALNLQNKQEFERLKGDLHQLKQDTFFIIQNISLMEEKVRQSDSDVGFNEINELVN